MLLYKYIEIMTFLQPVRYLKIYLVEAYKLEDSFHWYIPFNYNVLYKSFLCV